MRPLAVPLQVTSLPLEAFTRGFRRLDADERLDFVADLWAARGWVTTVVDGQVLVRDGDVERRVRVFAPRRFRRPDLDDVDVLVVTAGDAALESRAAEAEVRYVPPSALRDRLLYGVPRETAERLASEYLGLSLAATRADDAPDASNVPRSTWLDLERPGERLPDALGSVAAVLVVAIVVLAATGPGLLSSTDVPPTDLEANGSFTPGAVGAFGSNEAAGTETEAPAPMPPGLSNDEVTDVVALADATRSAMHEGGWVLRVSREGPDRSVWRNDGDRWRETFRVRNDTHYLKTTRIHYVSGDRTSEEVVERYADGETAFQRRTVEGADEFSRKPVENTVGVAAIPDWVMTGVLLYLTTNRTHVRCAGTYDGSDDCAAYHVTADGRPAYFFDVGNYTATATVTDAGVVSALRVEYTVSAPDECRTPEPCKVEFGWTLDAPADVTVSPPSWLPEAESRTGTETPTPGGSDGATTGTQSTAELTATRTEPSQSRCDTDRIGQVEVEDREYGRQAPGPEGANPCGADRTGGGTRHHSHSTLLRVPSPVGERF